MTRSTNLSGGSAAAGGFGFQANIGAIAGTHMLRGIPVQWTDGLTGFAPCAVSFETSGPGDDLSLELADGSIVEIQVRKGLRADRRFWSTIDALCEGIHQNRCSYGILIVCPNSSIPVRRSYALALERIGAGRNDGASQEHARLVSRLAEYGYDAKAVCGRIRIRMVSALENAGDAVAAARAELGHVCAEDGQVTLAWHALCQDSLSAIANKSRRTVSSLSERLRASRIEIQNAAKDSPVAISEALLRWTMSRTEHFEILGISRPLPIDQAWLPLSAVVRDAPIKQALSVEQALADYRALGEKPRTDKNVIDARTIGTFRKLCVVVGGPGSGKSLLLKVLAREFTRDSCVSVRVRLRDLAMRMQETGCGVEEGLMQLGVDSTGVTRYQLHAASLSDLVLLCDGLDECGERQFDIAAGLKDISASHPSYRIVVTTRPIGYRTSELRDWRHYEIVPLAEDDSVTHLETLCRCAIDEDAAGESDGLLSRIRAYLGESSASQLLARSPLLLAFGAALFMDSQIPSKTKLEIYQRIFRLIDGPSGSRQAGLEPPAKAIRNSVLNELGWLIAASPFQAAEEIERQCAHSMEQALGMTSLRAMETVENCINYWEEKGLIERLRHQGIELIAFIHKTCGEYAAALHLSEMDSKEARLTIGTALWITDWDEILDFATGTALGAMIAELMVMEFKTMDADEATLNRIFRVLVRPEASLAPTERASFLERVFALARSEDRQKAYRAGLCLTEHDLSRLPEAEQMALALVAAPLEWTRLVGWSVLTLHFPESLDRSALEDALTHFMERSRAKDFFVLRDSKLPFGPLRDQEMFENFILGALTSLLSGQDAEYQNRLIAEIGKLQPNATWGFVSRVHALLGELGREDAVKLAFRSTWFKEDFRFSVNGKYRAANVAMLTEVVPPAFLEDDVGLDPWTQPKYTSALFELAGIKKVPASDVYAWLSEEARLDAVHTLLRAAAYVYELPADRLAAEARQAIALGQSLQREWKPERFLQFLPDIDVAEVNWSRANQIDIDMRLVERLVHHPSQWVQHLAALFIDERLHDTARRSACERLLATGRGDALHWAAALTAELSDGCDLLVHRLGGRDADGLHHLFENLRTRGYRITPSHLSVLEKGLFNRGVKTAVSAARWCQDTASSADTWLVHLLRSASSYWVEHEEPYPVNGGTVPDSPREALLRTLCRIDPPPFERLVDLTGDPRRDVRDAAIERVIRLAKDSTEEKSRVVESIVAKQFSSRQCEKLLSSDVPYRSEEMLTLCDLCSDQDPSYRVIGVRLVLAHHATDAKTALTLAKSMKSDNDGNVRDAVHQFLDQRA